MDDRTGRGALVAAATALGIGMGGFVDGILFHQILQVHNMLSAVVPKVDLVSAEVNMFWDGLFHAATWTFTVVGIALLWHAVRLPSTPLSTPVFAGSILAGWGTFNLVEGLIDHHLLGIHHVVERLGPSGYDLAFLASGVAFMGIGIALIRSGT